MPPRSNLAAVLLAGWLAAACQTQAPSPPPVTVRDPGSRAAEALEKGDHRLAATLYREALGQKPEQLALHYGLAVAASHLDLRDETEREFRWVLTQGVPGSTEVEAARGWLSQAGLLTQTGTATASLDDGRQPGNARLEGRALFAVAGEELKPMRRGQLFLIGQPDGPTKEERYELRTDQDGNFKFPNVAPGPYKLTNRVDGPPIWRLRVELNPSEVQVLELTMANSVAVRDDFPERAQASEERAPSGASGEPVKVQ